MKTYHSSDLLPEVPIQLRAFRVICAWCGRPIESGEPPQDLEADSHGICPDCARLHFGVEIENGRRAA